MLVNIVTLVTGLAALAAAAPRAPFKINRSYHIEEKGIQYKVFDHARTGLRIKYKEDSGICETTKGVKQYSGYFSPASNSEMNIWFWFFAARQNPETAPLATWFNGGPGCSSMIGLFQENGPCYFPRGQKTPVLNPNSWNNRVNMLYIDQPSGTGFSYGSEDSVTGTDSAAKFMWEFMQAFYDQFNTYQNRDFGIFTESYGGHYGPKFADYFTEQNDAIDSGKVTGKKIKLVALGVNNGWIDPKSHYQSFIDYGYSNNYKRLISQSSVTKYNNAMTSSCGPALDKCKKSGSNSDCSSAESTCLRGIESPILNLVGNVYDIRARSEDEAGQPSTQYVTYLGTSSVKKAIGATSNFQECANDPYYNFRRTGDNSRSYLPSLADVINRNITTLIWAGDADVICNWYGSQTVANDVSKLTNLNDFASKPLLDYKVNGKAKGTFKTSGKFSFLRVFEAGHEVPFYQPDISLQAFEQTMGQKPLTST